MRSGNILLLALLLVLFSFENTHGQQIDPKTIEKSRKTTDGRFSFLKLDRNVSKYDTSITTIKRILNLGNRHSLRFDNKSIISTDLADRQNKHSRYNQYFEGLKIEFGALTVHSKSGALEILSGEYYNVPENFSVTPALSEANALSQALSFVGASKYSWQEGGFPDRSLNERPKGELVICKDFIAAQANIAAPPAMKLAYKFAIYAVQPLRYDHIYVDASTGKILLVNPIIKHADGTAATKYSGTRTISTSSHSSGGHTLKDTVGNYNIATWNCNRNPNYSNITEFIDSDNNWTDQEYNNGNLDNAALDAHWGTMKSYEYFKVKHNRNSFDNNGSRINTYVHFGIQYANAFWNGTSMTYGDGDGIQYAPLTTVDICGHEIAHAVCQYSANLIYSYESGALNESLSDIWGACIEHFSDPQKQTWLLGDECSLTGTPFRSMSNPNSQSQPDTYKGNLWYTGSGDNGGVHYNSGVMNYWFYLLSVGGSGVNDFGQSFNISGISIDKAASIVYRAETMYLFPSAIYPDARIAMLQAAADLYGANSNEYLQARKAWDAVGVIETLSTPYNFNAVYNGSTAVQLSWAYVNADNISGFAIERSINDTVSFQQIAFIDSNIRNFNDQNFVNDAVNIYRIRAVRGDSVYSKYTNVVNVAVGNAPLIMAGGNFSVCGITFLDPGGASNYPNYSSVITVLSPATPGTRIRARFNSFKTENNDYLRVYDGPGTYSYIGNYYGNIKPPVLQSTAPGGELTFAFNSNQSTTDSGWNAYVSCYKPINAISGLTASFIPQLGVTLQWNDLLTDETKFVIERSLNDSLNFQVWRELPANSTTYTDSTLSPSALVYYRIVAYWDQIESNYSYAAGAINGTVVLMQNGSITTCEGLFMDAGGLGNNTAQGTQTLTLRPAEVGKKIKLNFIDLNISSYGESLTIYDGSSVSAPLIGVFNGTNLPPLIESTAGNGELTIQYSGYPGNPGWKAQISCYLPVEAPTGLTTVIIDNKPSLNWVDQSNDETKFVIERSINSPRRFEVIVEVPANSTSFVDNSAPLNSLFFYRVRAFRETQRSPISNVSEIGLGNAPFLMKDSVLITCDKVFMDEGGVDMLSASSLSRTVTFKPTIVGNRVRVEFSSFAINNNYLYVYNGSSISAPLIGYYYYNSIPRIFDGTNSEGSLTFRFSNLGSYYDSGWVAKVSCYKPVSKPTDLNLTLNSSQLPVLTWTDNADDETNYIIERSNNSSTLFSPIANIPANAISYVDSFAAMNNFFVYRVKAQRDTFNSYYTDAARIDLGNTPFLMRDSVLVTCDKMFMDAGGLDVYPADNRARTVTFKPSIPGNRVRVRFHRFRTNTSLYVFNGPTAFQSPSLGTFNGYYIDSIFDGTGPDGSLTFYFAAPYYIDSGWIAYVSCYKPIPRPTNLQSSKLGERKVQLQWNDNADDEVGFIVERSINAPTLYASIAQVPANTSSFVDSLVPDNAVVLYRIKAFRDTINSFFSDTTYQFIGNAPLIMRDTTAMVCGKLFLDPGGVDIIPKTNRSYITTIIPPTANHRVRVSFRSLKISPNLSMYIYNGSGTNAPLLAAVNSNYPPPANLEGLNSSGALTFAFSTSTYYTDSGWVADVSCYKIVAKPTELSATYQQGGKPLLKWKDNADDETNFVVERSINSPVNYISIANLNANSNSYQDTSAPDNSLLFYRVRAYRDTLASFYSDTFKLNYGNSPYIMMDSTVTICDRLFMDAGGVGNVPIFNSKTTTLKPIVQGNRVKVKFEKFHLFNGNLRVYNGPNIYAPLIGVFSGTGPLPVFDGDGPDGSLTFVHYYGQTTDSGWVASVSCYKPVAKPNIGKAIPHGDNHIRIDWKDNADDETKYILERSVNSATNYKVVAELAANTTSFIDSNSVANSLIYYRVVASRDTLKSFYSDTTSFEEGNAPIIMGITNSPVCDNVFMDPGGIDVMPRNITYSQTILQTTLPNQKLRIVFSRFKLGAGASLTIHDGNSTYQTPVIGVFTDVNLPVAVESTNEYGALTLTLQNYNGNADSGWVAHISCFNGVAKPTNLIAFKTPEAKVKLRWNDNSEDETAYIIERSQGSQPFQIYAEIPANSKEYVDQFPGTGPNLMYRVAAKRQEQISRYTESINVSLATDTIIMHNGTYAGCGFILQDPGGNGNYPLNTERVITFYPTDNQSKIKATFKQFKFAQDYYDYLVIYNGNSVNAPVLTSGGSYSSIQTATSSATDGSLTFKFYSNSSQVDSGFIAEISCARYPSPSNLRATPVSSSSVKLDWVKADTIGMTVSIERAIGSPEGFQEITYGNLDSSYIDERAPMNSLIYYRLRLRGWETSSSYSNQVYVRTITCNNADSIVDKSTKQYFNTKGKTSFFDSTCRLVAKINPVNALTGLGNTKVIVKFFTNPVIFKGQHFVKRHYEINPQYGYQSQTSTTIYFTQEEFDSYNSATAHSKLPAHRYDYAAFDNLALYVFLGYSNNDAVTPEAYSSLSPVTILENQSIKLNWNTSYNCWELTAKLSSYGGIFLSSRNDTVSICSMNEPHGTTTTNSLWSNAQGYSVNYQWQKLIGNTWTNIFDSYEFTGTRTDHLQARNSKLGHGDQFRCLAGSLISKTYTINKTAIWEGNVSGDWNTSANWKCGLVPHHNSAILIEAGKTYYPNITNNVNCRSLTVKAGAYITLTSGHTIDIQKW